MTGAPLLFVSYAHEDKELCRRVVLMLGLALRARGYDVWWDQAIVAGRWTDQIDGPLQRAAAGVLLVSEYSLSSRFIMDQELPKLLARGKVAPIYCRPCPWEAVPAIAQLQFLGSADKALAELDESRGELAAALSALAKQAADFLGLPPQALESLSIRPAVAVDGGQQLVGTDGPGDLHGVPELPVGYFERTNDLDQLRAELLASQHGPGPLGVHGGAGMGKTVLASALARDPAVRRAFPDGIYWVVLGERPDPVGAQAALARLVGVEAAFRNVEDGRATLRQALHERRVLLVIDDAWSAADAEALLVTDLCGRVAVTTRHPLVLDRLRAERVPIDRLSLPDARRFLAQATGRPAPLPGEADALIETVGGVVLALALIGATISHGTTWADALAGVRSAADVFRDESFANQFRAMQVAWGALDTDAQARYRELAVFGEDVTAPPVTVGRLWNYTAGLDQRATEELCTEFAQRNLVAFEGGVSFHDLQRAFLQLQTPDSALAHRELLASHAGVPAVPDRWSTLPDDEPYLWDHLIEHLVAAGDVSRLEEALSDPVWLLRRYHLQGPHAPEADLLRGVDALPTYRTGALLLHRLRQVSHLIGAVPTVGDRALTFASQISDLIPTGVLASLFLPVRLRPRRSRNQPNEALERVITGHVGGVWSVAWSPDGRRLASGGLDGTVRIWDTDAAGRQRAALEIPAGGVRSVAWSPDAQHLAAGDDEGMIHVWDTSISSGRPAATTRHGASVWSVAWSPDGHRLASAGSDGTVRIWEPNRPDRPPVAVTGHRGSVWSVAWSPDGRQVASGGADGTVQLWNPDGPPSVLGRHDGWAWAVAWSPDGRRIASGGDRTVRIWHVAGDGADTRLTGHEDLVWSVAWSPDGRQIASASSDKTVRVWQDDEIVLAGHDDHVWSVGWSPDNRRLVSGCHDEMVRIWDTTSPAQTPTSAGCWVWSVAWSPDGRELATAADDGAVRVWDPDAPGTPLVVLADVDGGVWSVAWSGDGRHLAAGGADRIVRVWEASDWERPAVQLNGHRGLVRSLRFSPDGGKVATVSDDGTIRVWDLAGSPVILNREDDPMRSRSVAWSPDGTRLVSGCDDGALRIWDAGIPRQRPCVRAGHTGRVESVSWSPDGRRLASGGLDGTVRVWNSDDATEPVMIQAEHSDPVTAVAWSPDGTWLASGGDDRTVRLLDVSSGGLVSAFGIGSMVCSLAWSGNSVAVGTATSWTVLLLEDDRP